MKKKLISLCLALVLLLQIPFPATAYALSDGSEPVSSVVQAGDELSLATETDSMHSSRSVSPVRHVFDGRQYAIVRQPVSWTQAKELCESMGGHLATITSSQEQEFITKMIREETNTENQGYFLGASDARQEGTWEWVTGEPFSYSNWGSGEPNNSWNGTEHYLVINIVDDYTTDWLRVGSWNDVNEGYTAPNANGGFICEWETVSQETLSQPKSIEVMVAADATANNMDLSEVDTLLKARLKETYGISSEFVDVNKINVSYVDNTFDWIRVDHAVTSDAVLNDGRNKAPLYNDPYHNLLREYNTSYHIDYQESKLTFYGYSVPAYKDFLYMDNNQPDNKVFTFKLDESSVSYHTAEGTGFLFNTEYSHQEESGKDLLSGYLLLFDSGYINVYQLTNIDVNSFSNSSSQTLSSAASSSTAWGGTVKRLYRASKPSPSNGKIRYLKVVASPEEFSFYQFTDETYSTVKDKIIEHYQLPEKATSFGFGPFAAYVSHYCSDLTRIVFENLTMSTDDSYDISHIIKNSKWKEQDSIKVWVNIDNDGVADINNTETMLSALYYLLRNNAHYVGWGVNNPISIAGYTTVQEQAEGIIQRNQQKGMFINRSTEATATMEQGVDKLAEYIAALYQAYEEKDALSAPSLKLSAADGQATVVAAADGLQNPQCEWGVMPLSTGVTDTSYPSATDITFPLNENEDYIILARIRDGEGGQWSPQSIIYASSSIQDPIVDFTLDTQVIISGDDFSGSDTKTITAKEYSFAPLGKSITQWQWSVYNANGQTVSSLSKEYTADNVPERVTFDFSGMAKGKYTLSLKVKTDGSDWSEAFIRNIDVVDYADGCASITRTSQPFVENTVLYKDTVNVTAEMKSSDRLSKYRIIRRNVEDNSKTVTRWIMLSGDNATVTSTVSGGIYEVYLEAITEQNQMVRESLGVFSNAVDAADAAAPVVTVEPALDSFIGSNTQIRVSAADETKLYHIRGEIKTGDTYTAIAGKSTQQPQDTLTFTLDPASVAEGPVEVRAYAFDCGLNTSEPVIMTYTADFTAPQATAPVLSRADEANMFTWSAGASDANGVKRYELQGSADQKAWKTICGEDVADIQQSGEMDGTFAAAAVEKDMEYFRICAIDIAGNQGYSEAVAFDAVAPTVPGGLMAEKLFSKSVQLKWTASYDKNGVKEYAVLRDGKEIAKTAETKYYDSGLTTATAYRYQVVAYDQSGNPSAAAELEVTPGLPVINTLTTSLGDQKIGGLKPVRIQAYVADNLNLGGLSGDATAVGEFFYSENGVDWVLIGKGTLTSSSGKTFYETEWDLSALHTATYQLKFVLTDIDEGSSEKVISIDVDRTHPAEIASVSAMGDVHKVLLSWGIAAELDTQGYKVYRKTAQDAEYQLVATIIKRNILSYTDLNVEVGQEYFYMVKAYDLYEQESLTAVPVSAIPTEDNESPVITSLTPKNGSLVHGLQTVKITAEDNVAVARVEFYVSYNQGETWEKVLETENNSSFSMVWDTKKYADGAVRVKAIAYDQAGNASSGGLVYTYYIDNHGPEKITGLSYESTATTALLRWNDVADEDFYYFQVEEKTASGEFRTVEKIYTTLGINLSGLQPGNEYTYRVVAYDKAGNRGTESDEITVVTTADSTAPVITSIMPRPGYYNESIPFSVKAYDDFAIAEVIIQSSKDGKSWTAIAVKTLETPEKNPTVSYTIDLSDYSEGGVYFRAIAVDTAGNQSDSSAAAPYSQYMVDKTAPAAPTGLQAVPQNGHIELQWVQGSENDIAAYALYRSESQDGEYTLLDSHITYLNYFDRAIEANQVYYYKLKVVDLAGNSSEFSAAISAQMENDTQAPEIVSINPASGSTFGPEYCTLSVLAEDNNRLSSITIEYKTDGSYQQLTTVTDIKESYRIIQAKLPLEAIADGTQVTIRAIATDIFGNRSSEDTGTAVYTVDKTPPAIQNLQALAGEEQITLTWLGGEEADLAGYRIYRRLASSAQFALIGQRTAAGANYSYTDTTVEDGIAYYYKVEAVDTVGNIASAVSAKVNCGSETVIGAQKPKAVLKANSVMEVGVEYIIDGSGSTDDIGIVSYHIDFGDGSSTNQPKASHVYTQPGNYLLQLSVVDGDGNTSVAQQNVLVTEREAIGKVAVTVVDDNGRAVAGAPVYFDLGGSNQVVAYTDGSGIATFESAVGKFTVGTYQDGYLPVKREVAITSGDTQKLKLVAVKQPIVTGEFEIHRMSLSEIKAAGIDVTAPENQNVLEITGYLFYGKNNTVHFSFNVNDKGIIDPKPIHISSGSGASGGSGGRTLYPSIIPTKDKENPIVAMVDLPMKASFLKDFFDVKLHIINNASEEFSLLDNTVMLNVPSGLSVVNANGRESSTVVTIPEIKGQQTRTLNWVLRGDSAGSYQISADFMGTVSEFNTVVNARFEAKDPIYVRDAQGLKLVLNASTSLHKGNAYFNFGLKNEGRNGTYIPDVDVEGAILRDMQLEDAFGEKSEIETAPETLEIGNTLWKRFYKAATTEGSGTWAEVQENAGTFATELGIPLEVNFYDITYFVDLYELYPQLNPDNKALSVYINKNDASDETDHYVAAGNIDVMVDGQKQTTDKYGDLMVEVKEGEQKDVSISLDGYMPYAETLTHDTPKQTNIYLEKQTDLPILKQVIAKSALTSINIRSNTLKIVKTQPANYNIIAEINWNGNTPGKVYVKQGSTQIPLSEQGETGLINLAEKLVPNQEVYLVVQAQNGKTVQKELKIRVSAELPIKIPSTIPITDSLDMGSGTGLLSSVKFSLTLPGVPTSFSMEDKTDGTTTVKLLIGIKGAEKKKGEAWEQLYKGVKSMCAYSGSKFDSNIDKWGQPIDGKIGVKFSGNFAGYMEMVCYYENGQLKFKNVTGGATLDGSAKVGGEHPLPPPVSFIFIEWYIKAAIKAQLSVGYNFQKSSPEVKADLTPSLGVGLGAGIGVPVLASLSAGGTGTVSMKLPIPKVSTSDGCFISLGAYVKYCVLGFSDQWDFSYKNKLRIYPFPVCWVDAITNEPVANSKAIRAADTSTMELLPRDYLGTPSKFMANYPAKQIRGNSNETDHIVKSNVYPESAPTIVDLGDGKALLVWVDDDAARTAINRSTLMYSYFNGQAWSAPQMVDNDGTADFMPVLKTIDNVAYLAWQDASRVFQDSDQINTIAKDMDIAVAIFDETTQSFTGKRNLSSNGSFDTTPVIFGTREEISVAWLTSDTEDILNDFTNNQIQVAAYRDGLWSKAQVAAEGLAQVDGISGGYSMGKRYLAYTLDCDGDVTTPADKELYLVSESGVTRLTNDDVTDTKPCFTDNGELYWYRNGSIYQISNVKSPVLQEVFASDNLNTDRFKMITNAAGNKAVIFEKNDGYYSSVYAAIYDKTTAAWGEPVQMTANDGKVTAFDGFISDAGKIQLVMNKNAVNEEQTANPYGQADLCMTAITPGRNLTISEDIYADSRQLVAGNMAELKFAVSNSGQLAVTGMKATLMNEQDEELLTKEVKETLLPGGEMVLSVFYRVPDDFDGTMSLKIKIEPTDGDDVNLKDNVWTTAFSVLDVAVSDSHVIQTEDQLVVKSKVMNLGYQDLSQVSVLLVKDEPDGQVVDTWTAPTVPGRNSINVSFALDKSAAGIYYILIKDLEGETYTGNNYEYIVIDDTNAQFQIDVLATAGGSATGGGLCQRGDQITLNAQAEDGYLFAGWYQDEVLLSEDAVYTFSASADLSLKAVFKPEEYQVTDDSQNGRVIADPASCTPGTTVSLTVQPEEGYQWVEGSITVNGEAISGTSFVMPEENVTVKAQFARNDSYFALKEKIQAASMISTTAYTLSSVQSLQTAIQEAKAVLDNAITPEIANQQIDLLNNAIAGLEKQKYHISIIAEHGTVIGLDVNGYEAGTVAGLKAVPDETYQFVNWTDASGKVLGVNPNYSVTVTEDLTLTANFIQNQYVVVFQDYDGKLLSTQTVPAGQPAAAPETPSRVGYQFLNWDKPYDNITENTTITAVYEKDMTYQIEVVNGSGSGKYMHNDFVTVVADPPADGQMFSCWTVNGTVVSYSPTYRFLATADMVITAEYAYRPSEIKPLITINDEAVITKTADTKGNITWNGKYTLPEGYTFVECGAVLGALDTTELVIGAEGAVKVKLQMTTSTGHYSITMKNVAAGKTRYARMYLIYQDASGNLCTIYSDKKVACTMQ